MVRAYLFLSLFIPLTFLFAASALLCSLVDASGRAYAFHARWWARLSLGLVHVPVVVRGARNLPDGPVIFMSNHQSNFDILALLASMPRQINLIAKKELFDIPVFGASMRRGGYIPLDRSDGRQALKSMDSAAAVIRSGKSVVMFPEGTRSLDCRLLPFKRGGFLLALKAGVPVIPVTINGSGRVNPAGRTRIYRGAITITLHPAVMPASAASRSEAENRLMEQVRTAIGSALEV
ncbi:lysophospholipid acyltransferase family protein [Geobacter sp. SVR]|uniref:lysophospholipid acyltransferase family protein n=1 Tax=Geobacter sp. SVR TaxID=2495594 RepID=UPI00143EF4E3|nr:lysophospholipid acyltransferase family protein [Geobacter sp. SVR]BCS55914.1 1-acyl-sn-glycerol-3-phosphate acyltransferase [Geobacter sp. SVR]GCF84677.1 1-acyl-sn-glycerol-3-phosphate acyltransferase [Geobacter sp. SVR]